MPMSMHAWMCVHLCSYSYLCLCARECACAFLFVCLCVRACECACNRACACVRCRFTVRVLAYAWNGALLKTSPIRIQVQMGGIPRTRSKFEHLSSQHVRPFDFFFWANRVV